MQVVIPAGYNEMLPIMKKPPTFLLLANRELFSQILSKLSNHEVIVVTPEPKYFKHYEVQVIKDDFSGAAGAIKAAEKVIEDTFAVHFSDIWSSFRIEPLLKFHRERKAVLTMALANTPFPWKYGIVSTDPTGFVTRYLFAPKKELVFSNKVDAGIYVLEPELFDYIPYKLSMNEFLSYLVNKNARVYGYLMQGVWYHIGSKEEYVYANEDFLKRIMEVRQENVTGVNAFPPVNLVNVKAKLAMLGPSVSASDVTLGENVKVVNSVIFPGAEIGDNTIITNSVIGPNVRIENNVAISESLIGEGSRVYENAKLGNCIIGIEKDVAESAYELVLL